MKLFWAPFLLLSTALRIQGAEDAESHEGRQMLYPPPLVNPFGGTFKLIVGLAVPVQLSGRILVYGQNMQFQYTLPDNATFFANFFDGSSRRQRRNISWNERTPIYDMVQQELDRRNVDGRGCLKRDICEAASSSLKDEGLVGELLHLLLTPDQDSSMMDSEFLAAAAAGRRREDCSRIYPTCPPGVGILDRISTVY
ncbi:uncharacterized protein LOC143181742 isoform X2 [Calliopsis andreniformis]